MTTAEKLRVAVRALRSILRPCSGEGCAQEEECGRPQAVARRALARIGPKKRRK